MNLQIKLPARVGTFLLTSIALATGILSLSGVEKKFFTPQPIDDKQIESKMEKAETAIRLANQLQARVEIPNKEISFALSPPEKPEQEIEVSPQAPPKVAPKSETLLFTGVAVMPDQTRRAVINGSIVSEGSRLRGCLIKQITNTHIYIEENNEVSVVPLYTEYVIKSVSGPQELKLERIIEQSGQWQAVFKGQNYRVGSQLDQETKILAITPSQVLIERNGKEQSLRPPSE